MAAALTVAAACGKEEPVAPSPEPQPPTMEQQIVGLWGLIKVNNQVPNYLNVTTCNWEFTTEHKWIQTTVYNDGVHYDSVVGHAIYTFVGDDSVTLAYEDGHIGGFRVIQCDDSILHTRGWYAETHSYYTYTLERLR